MKIFHVALKNKLATIVLLFVFLSAGGCSTITSSSSGTGQDGDPDSSKTIAENVPYYSKEFSDLLIPGELEFNNDKTMSIRTESFAGGILNFSGRVEMNSLADFFATTMEKNGWKLTGTIKHKEILLAFVKPYKTCMLRISKSGLGTRTEVYAYITEDITATQNQ